MSDLLDPKVVDLCTKLLKKVKEINPTFFENHLLSIRYLPNFGGLEIECGAYTFTCNSELHANLSNMKSHDFNYRFPEDLDQAAHDFSYIF